jgi:sec-independent protein translocase protein TatB
MILLGVALLVIVGPKRMPEVMRQAGRLFVHLRRTANDVRSTFDQVIQEAEKELRLEEAEALRKALKPVQDLRGTVQSYVANQIQGQTPEQIQAQEQPQGHPPTHPVPPSEPQPAAPAGPQAGQTLDATATPVAAPSTGVPGAVPFTPGSTPTPAAPATTAPPEPAAHDAPRPDAAGAGKTE